MAKKSACPNATTLRGIHEVVYEAWDRKSGVGRELFDVYENQLRKAVREARTTGS